MVFGVQPEQVGIDGWIHTVVGEQPFTTRDWGTGNLNLGLSGQA